MNIEKIPVPKAGEFNSVYRTLRKDIDDICQPTGPHADGRMHYPDTASLAPSQRRGLIRAIFAHVEACTYLMRLEILETAAEKLPAHVVMALRELQIELRPNGEVSAKALKAKSMSLLRLTFATYSKVVPGLEHPLCAGPGFEALANSVKVRDRLTHPKVSEDLTVTDSEILTTIQGFCWFDVAMEKVLRGQLGLFKAKVASYKEQIAEMNLLANYSVTREDPK